MAETRDVTVPDIGDFSDVPVIEILVSEGDEVGADDPLVTLESEKATMDVPAPFAGKVVELKVSVDDKVSEGDPIMVLEVEDGDGADGDGADAEADKEEGEEDAGGEQVPAGEGAEDSGREEYEGEEAPEAAAEQTEAQAGDEERPDDSDEPENEAGEEDGAQEPEAAAAGEGADEDEERRGHPDERSPAPVYASPAVRRLARELDVDLDDVEGTGRKGRITKDDVRKAKERPPQEREEGEREGGVQIPGLELAPWPQIDHSKYGEVERVKLSRIKRISGPNLTRNWVMIPHVTHEDEADITELEAFRKQVNSEQDVKVTMVALLVKACVGSLKQFPEFNSSLDGDELVLKRYYNIGFAADTPQGLLVPVIRDADRKGILEIAGELRELSGRAREGKLSAEEMRGSTFTISSLGGIGGTGFTPIINAPEVAILGVTRAATRPVWNGEEFQPRLIVPLSLSYDHRVIDGAAAARFVAHLASELTDLRRVLL